MLMTIAFIACGGGFLLSLFMFFKKQSNKTLLCPREHPCDIVLHSRFSKTVGIPNELLGAIYFFSVAVLLLIPVSEIVVPWMLYGLFFLLITGGLFSLYLLGVQAFSIRAWCLWCLSVAALNMILIISLSTLPVDQFTPFLKDQKLWWGILHSVGFILGIGAATITDIFFFRFLKDNTISQEEKENMDTLSSIVWAALAILVVSGIALFLPESARLLASAKFLLKITILGVLILNGVFLNMFVAPHLRRLSFEGTIPARRFRRLAFSLGGISITSWYIVFLLGSFQKVVISLSQGLIGYGVCLVAVIVGACVVEHRITKQHQI